MPLPIALHTIGQTPRPDLVPFVEVSMPGVELIITGALDGLSAADIEPCKSNDFPLETRLKDGSRIVVGASFLEPHIQRHILALQGQVSLHFILCAGPFPNLTSTDRLVRPFEHACEVLTNQNSSSLGIVVPFEGQAAPASAKWKKAGFNSNIYTMDSRPKSMSVADWMVSIQSMDSSDAFLLDYVGYPKSVLDEANQRLATPIFDLGYLAADFVRQLTSTTDMSSNEA